VLPRFTKTKRRTKSVESVLLNISWGTLTFGITMSRKPFNNDFEHALYPHERLRTLAAILLIVLIYLFIAYLFVHKTVEQPVKQGDERGELIFVDLQAENKPNTTIELPQPLRPVKPPKKQTPRQRRSVTSTPAINNQLESPSVKSPSNITSQIAAAREKRNALEEEAAQQDQAAQQGPSEDDLAMARIKANIQSANYNRKGANGIFQVLNKGVQTGRFSFRGWENDPRQSVWKTYEVDAGVGGNVELALIRRMIELIREHYSGDFNWESQRLGRVVVLSARPKDTVSLERFLMKEFFDAK